MFTYGLLNTNNTIASIVQSETRIDDTDHVFISAEANFDGTSYIGKSWARPTPTWTTITRRQGKQQLVIDGLDASVQTAIDSVTDITQRKLLQIYFDDADTWGRNHSSLIALGTSIGLDSTQLDTMFESASKL